MMGIRMTEHHVMQSRLGGANNCDCAVLRKLHMFKDILVVH
jgi:hypothetical protein